MFDVLVGSRSRRERSVWRGVASAFCHLAVIAGAARATAHEDAPPLQLQVTNGPLRHDC